MNQPTPEQIAAAERVRRIKGRESLDEIYGEYLTDEQAAYRLGRDCRLLANAYLAHLDASRDDGRAGDVKLPRGTVPKRDFVDNSSETLIDRQSTRIAELQRELAAAYESVQACYRYQRSQNELIDGMSHGKDVHAELASLRAQLAARDERIAELAGACRAAIKCLKECRVHICNVSAYEDAEAGIICAGCDGIDQTTDKLKAALALESEGRG